MSAGREIFQSEQWLYTTLKAGTALCAMIGGTANPRIYSHQIPQDNASAFPCVVFNYAGGSDEYAIAGERASIRALFNIKAIAKGGGFGTASTIMGQVDALLHQQGGSVSGLVVQDVIRESVLHYTTEDQGETYFHDGGTYRFWAAST